MFSSVCVVLLSRQQRQKQYAKTTSMWGWFIGWFIPPISGDFKDGLWLGLPDLHRFTRFFDGVNCVYHPFLVFF